MHIQYVPLSTRKAIASPGPTLLRWTRYTTRLAFSCLASTFPFRVPRMSQVIWVLGGTGGNRPAVVSGTLAKQHNCSLGMFPGSASHHALVSAVYPWLPASMSCLWASPNAAFDTKTFTPLLPANMSTTTPACPQILLPATYVISVLVPGTQVPLQKHCL